MPFGCVFCRGTGFSLVSVMGTDEYRLSTRSSDGGKPVESDQPQKDDKPKMQSVPRAYVNFAAAQGSPTELALTLGYQQPSSEALIAAHLVMSWEHVPVLIDLLQKQVDEYRRQIGDFPDLLAQQKRRGTHDDNADSTASASSVGDA